MMQASTLVTLYTALCWTLLPRDMHIRILFPLPPTVCVSLAGYRLERSVAVN
jgi:hypothetical protein